MMCIFYYLLYIIYLCSHGLFELFYIYLNLIWNVYDLYYFYDILTCLFIFMFVCAPSGLF